MPLPPLLQGKLRLPVIGAPLFIVSNPALVIAQCKAGIVGAFPALNARPQDELDRWLARIESELAAHRAAHPGATVAPFAVNQIVHASNGRLDADLDLDLLVYDLGDRGGGTEEQRTLRVAGDGQNLRLRGADGAGTECGAE